MTEEQIEEAAKEYSGLTDNPKDSYSRVKGSLCIAFKDGAYWCIKSVWHDASETPEIVKLLLVEKENVTYHCVGCTRIMQTLTDGNVGHISKIYYILPP